MPRMIRTFVKMCFEKECKQIKNIKDKGRKTRHTQSERGGARCMWRSCVKYVCVLACMCV